MFHYTPQSFRGKTLKYKPIKFTIEPAGDFDVVDRLGDELNDVELLLLEITNQEMIILDYQRRILDLKEEHEKTLSPRSLHHMNELGEELISFNSRLFRLKQKVDDTYLDSIKRLVLSIKYKFNYAFEEKDFESLSIVVFNLQKIQKLKNKMELGRNKTRVERYIMEQFNNTIRLIKTLILKNEEIKQKMNEEDEENTLFISICKEIIYENNKILGVLFEDAADCL